MSDGSAWLTRRRIAILAVYLVAAGGLTLASQVLDRRLQTELGLRLSVYDNAAFKGEPVFRTTTPDVSLGFLEDHPDLPRRFFSARWEGVWYVPDSRTVELFVGGDDRVVVRIDGRTVLERNLETGLHTESRPVTVDAGFHDLSVDYAQFGGEYGLTVQSALVGKAPRAFDPETLFPSPPSQRALSVNQRLHLFRRATTWVWVVPPLLLLALVGVPVARGAGSRSTTRTLWLAGSSVFGVAFLGYWLNVLHFEPIVFARRQNFIFSADTWSTIGSMSELTFRDHIRQHPLFSLVTSTLVQTVQALSPAGLNRAILVTVALVAAANCTLAYAIFQRQLRTTSLACWLTMLYGCLFINLALFSIPETYALSTSMVLLYLLAAVSVRSPLGARQLVTLTLLATLAGLFNPPLLSLSVIHLLMLLRDRGLKAAIAPGLSSLGAAALVFALANLTIFGPDFYLNYVVDDQRYGSIFHFQSVSSIGTVLCGLFLFSVIAPRGYLTHHFTMADLTGYLESIPGGLAVAAYATFMVYVLWRMRPWADPLVLGLVTWLLTMAAFYIYFNPDGVMLYSVQVSFPLLLLAAAEFARLSPAFNAKYVLLGVFSCLVIIRNVAAVYAPIEIAP